MAGPKFDTKARALPSGPLCDDINVQKAYFEQLFHSLPEAVAILDAHGVITDINQEFTSLFGYGRDDALGAGMARLLPPEERRHEAVAMCRRVLGGESVYLETLRQSSDGRDIEVSLLAAPIKVDELQVGALVIFRDLTGLKDHQRDLAMMRERLAQIIEFLPDATFVVDSKGVVLAWNKAMEQMTGVAAQDMVGHDGHAYATPFYGKRRPMLIDLALKRDAQAEREYLTFVAEGDRLFAESHHPGLKSGGAYLWSTARPLYDNLGRKAGAIESIRDITERHRQRQALEASEEENRRIVEELYDIFFRADLDGVFKYVSPSVKRVLGHSTEAVVGRRMADFFVRPGEADDFMNLLRRQGYVEQYEAEVLDSEGVPRWVSTSARLLRGEEGQPVAVEGTSRDVHELRAAQQGLRQSRERLRSILDATPLPMVITGADGQNVLFANPGARDFFRDSAGLVHARPVPLFFADPADRAHLDKLMAKNGEVRGFEAGLVNGRGQWLWATLSVTPLTFDDKPALLTTLNDITRRKAMEEELKRLATTDALTGALNRRRFMELADREEAGALRYGRPLSMLMIDIDHFKRINDTHGHAAGDAALVELVEVCQQALRTTDVFGRVGGEEFAAALPETDLREAAAVAGRLRQAVEDLRVTVDGQSFGFTVSVGVAQLHPDGEALEQLISRADDALYEAKRLGRNRVVKG